MWVCLLLSFFPHFQREMCMMYNVITMIVITDCKHGKILTNWLVKIENKSGLRS